MFGLLLASAAVLAWLYVGIWLSVVFMAAMVGFVAFFRDPKRKVPGDAGVLVSPADGKIVEISEIEDCAELGGRVLKIGIFLSVFNAHVNRSPAAGTVRKLEHRLGKFYNALREKAGALNESNDVLLDCPDVPGETVLVKQIAGTLARRIVCGCKIGQELARGQRFGMIKFGSRTELYVKNPEELRVAVKKGDRVKAGSSVLVRY